MVDVRQFSMQDFSDENATKDFETNEEIEEKSGASGQNNKTGRFAQPLSHLDFNKSVSDRVPRNIG